MDEVPDVDVEYGRHFREDHDNIYEDDKKDGRSGKRYSE